MCSRFEPAEKEDVVLRWDVNPGSNVLGSAKWSTIFPKYDTLLITYANEPIVRSWGLTPEWAKRPLINAKSEEAHTKRTFTPLLNSRCVIPAASYPLPHTTNGRVRRVQKSKPPLSGIRYCRLPVSIPKTSMSCSPVRLRIRYRTFITGCRPTLMVMQLANG